MSEAAIHFKTNQTVPFHLTYPFFLLLLLFCFLILPSIFVLFSWRPLLAWMGQTVLTFNCNNNNNNLPTIQNRKYNIIIFENEWRKGAFVFSVYPYFLSLPPSTEKWFASIIARRIDDYFDFYARHLASADKNGEQ